MKKAIAVAAGLMLTGALVTTASAAVSFSGDARFRGYYESNYDFGIKRPVIEGQAIPRSRTNKEEVKANSRYRVKIDADAKGGAYVRSRIKIGDGTQGLTDTTKTQVNTDYMYLGVPMGPITVEGGRMPAHITLFFVNDDRYDMIIGKWANEMTDLQFWYRSIIENEDLINDNDVISFTGILTQKFASDWGMTLAGVYVDNQVLSSDLPADGSGFTGTINFTGPAGPVALEAEFAYRDSNLDIDIDQDDGYGGYLQGGMDFGATSVSLMGGWAQDGFTTDGDFGFIMLGGGSSITPSQIAHFGEISTVNGTFNSKTTFVGGKVGFKASEALTLTGILAYADYDDFGDGWEISGRAKYGISDGANIQWDMGFLSWSADDNFDNNPFQDEKNPFGTALTLNVSF
jgi:hypothetical protein